MEVKLAECAGFCFGVKRALDTVYEQLNKGKTIYTYGPIVHNEEVVQELADKGVKVLESEEALRALESIPAGQERPVIVIRAHGVSEEITRLIEEKGMECVDATCPFVKRIHRIVEKETKEDSYVVIVGNPGHPEVEGILGWCKGPAKVIENAQEAEQFTLLKGKKLCVVSQTTFNYNKFQNLVEILQNKGYNVNVANTICNATEERQRAARLLAAESDVMIVIGGRHSSNTRKLYDICKEECADTYYIQTLDDLHLELPKAVRLVGITAGASTPNKSIEEVQNYVRINF
jgi:4-hydroxy-3-methylbut-2-enyl diphosphate reductase